MFYFLLAGFVPIAASECPGRSAGRYSCAGGSRQREEEDRQTFYLHPVAGTPTCVCYYTPVLDILTEIKLCTFINDIAGIYDVINFVSVYACIYSK